MSCFDVVTHCAHQQKKKMKYVSRAKMVERVSLLCAHDLALNVVHLALMANQNVFIPLLFRSPILDQNRKRDPMFQCIILLFI